MLFTLYTLNLFTRRLILQYACVCSHLPINRLLRKFKDSDRKKEDKYVYRYPHFPQESGELFDWQVIDVVISLKEGRKYLPNLKVSLTLDKSILHCVKLYSTQLSVCDVLPSKMSISNVCSSLHLR